MTAIPPLLLDGTLIRLARWLRLQGYDAKAIASTDPLIVLRAARPEARLVLTRDRNVARQPGIETRLITSSKLSQQLEQVQTTLGQPPDDTLARCPDCNVPLADLTRQAAQGRVPPYVWRTADRFSQCPACHRVFWPGTHWAHIEDALQR